jgi:hypothetical protein
VVALALSGSFSVAHADDDAGFLWRQSSTLPSITEFESGEFRIDVNWVAVSNLDEEALFIELTGGERVRIHATEAIEREDTVTLIGQCEGAPPRSSVVTFGPSAAAGSFMTANGQMFDVMPTVDSHALIRPVDPELAQPCSVGDDPPFFSRAEFESSEPELSQGDARFDVLLVFTQNTVDQLGALGGQFAVENFLEISTNEALLNSNIDASIRLVYVAVTDFDETGVTLSTTLSRLRNPNDGYMDEVHSLRDAYGADLVALITASGTEGCGRAYVFNNPGDDFSDSAFSVTRIDCAFSLRTFAHELGHNFGCAHDHISGGVSGHFPYSYGLNGPGWRTLMALGAGSRIPHFSNPDVEYNGNATGVDVALPNPAHNALSINSLRRIIELWRPETACISYDRNGDGVINGVDISIVIAEWGGEFGDLNGSGVVDGADLALVLANWGACPDF